MREHNTRDEESKQSSLSSERRKSIFRLTEGGFSMEEQALKACAFTVLAEHYGQATCTLLPLTTRFSDHDQHIVYQMYLIVLPDASRWVMVLAHEGIRHTHTYRWATQTSPQQWLEERAAILKILATFAYPAPQIVPTLSGTDIIQVGPLSCLVTTYINGEQCQFLPLHLTTAGRLLAQLHTLPDLSTISFSWWNTTYSLPYAITSMENISPSLPRSQRSFLNTCLTAFHTIHSLLPIFRTVLIHGDGWMQNFILTPEQSMYVIDWESAGKGATILDLADALLRSQCEPSGALPTTIKETSITAIATGYAQYRTPTDEEFDMLVDAMRFGVAWRAAWTFTQIPFVGWSSSIERRVTHLETAFSLVDSTAKIALSVFLQSRSSAS